MSQPSDDSIKRQIEINEWSYQNKMDTVFSMQITFIAIGLVGILFYFKNTGAVGAPFTYYTGAIVVILVALIIINRLFFTSARRDPRLWHRFRFGEDQTKVPDTINNVGVNDLLAKIKGLSAEPDCTKCAPTGAPTTTGASSTVTASTPAPVVP
jgi:hypothetical protein